MRGHCASLLLTALVFAQVLCNARAQTSPIAVPAATASNTTANTTANITSAPTVAGGPLPAHHWGQGIPAAQPIDFTTGPATTAAFVHLSFGINVWNPQLTVAMFNTPGIRALFAQSIKNAVPDAVVVSEPLPATKGILVRSTVRFQADPASAKAQADNLVKYLTTATLLKQMLPEANWHPVLAYTTFPYLASAVVRPVGPATDRTPSLHFTIRVPGIKKATFNAQKLDAWKAALKTALPGLTEQGITAITTESTELGGRNYFARTDTLVHTQVTGPSLQALRQLSPKLLRRPDTVWRRRAFGSVEAVPASWVIVAFAAPEPGNVLYLLFETKDIMPFTAAKQAQLAAVLVDAMAVHPSYTSASVELTIVASSPGGRRRLQAIPKGRTLVKAEFKPTTQVDVEMLSNSVPTILEGAMIAKDKRLSWAQGGVCISTAAALCKTAPAKPEETDKKIVWQTGHTGTLNGNPWKITADGTSIRFNVEKSKNCGGNNAKVQKGAAGAQITVGAAPLQFDFILGGSGQLRHEGYDTMTVKLDYKTIVATARSAGGGSICSKGPLVVKKYGTWPVTFAPGSVHRLDVDVKTNDGQNHKQSFYHLDLYFKNAGQPVKDCSNDQTYCIYCGNKRATCIPDGGQQCKAYYHDYNTDQRTPGILQPCSMLQPGKPGPGTGKCPSTIISGDKLDFKASRFPTEDGSECLEECKSLQDQTYCIYCGTKRATCIAKGKPCLAYYKDPRTGKRIPAPLQLCASPAFAPRGDPTSGPGTCPAFITISVDGARQTAEFEDSKYPDETVTECGCDGLPHDDDFEISRKVPAIMADCIKRLKKAHPNWTFHFYQTKDAAKMNLTTFAAAQYAYGDRVLNEQTYTSNKAGKVSNICSTMEPNKDIALRLKNWCLGTDGPSAKCRTDEDTLISLSDWRGKCAFSRVMKDKMPYFINAVNFLDDGTLGPPCRARESFTTFSIYQFLDFTQYDSITTSDKTVEAFLIRTLTHGSKPTGAIGPSSVAAHARWFYEAAQAGKLLPQFLIAKSAAETGYWANSDLTTVGVLCNSSVHKWGPENGPYESCHKNERAYNYFNMGAYDAVAHSTVLNSAAIEGFKQKWFSQEEAVRGGIARFSQEYVQNKERAAFNYHILDWNLRYWARNEAIGLQYATNVADALLKGRLLGSILLKTAQNDELTFRIPVFQDQGFVKCSTPPPAGCPTYKGFTLKRNVYSPKGDFGQLQEPLDAVANECSTGCKAFTTSGWLKSQVWPEQTWNKWTGSGPCDGMYVRDGITYDVPPCAPEISKNKEYCAYCGYTKEGQPARKTCVGASGVACKAEDGTPADLCSAMTPSPEGSGQGSCPKTIKVAGITYNFKGRVDKLAGLPSCFPDCSTVKQQGKVQEYCAFCGKVGEQTLRKTCVGASSVPCKASNGDTLQLCAGLEPSAEGIGYGSCPKTIKWAGSTFSYKQQENDLDKLKGCAAGYYKAVFVAPSTQPGGYCGYNAQTHKWTCPDAAAHRFTTEADSMQHLAPFVVKELKARGYTVAQYPVQFAQDTASIDYVTVKTQKAREFKNGLPSGDRDRVLYLSLHSDASKATFGLKGDDCVGHMSIIPQCHDNKAAAIGKAMAEAIIKTAGYKASKTTKYYNHFATYKKCGATNYNLKPPAWDVNMYEGWAEWRVPRGAGMATILLELGFHDTQCDVLWISSDATRKLIAKAIADALDAST